MLSFYPLLLAVLYLGLAAAQNLPFLVTGFLDSATAKPGSATNRGGEITISGFTVTIPDNLLVEFPALFVPFAEFATANGQAGVIPNEVTITGNVLGNQIIAGQLAISQLDLAFASGVIQSLSPDGAIQIQNGPIVRINDPRARYSSGYTALPFFTADDENPSITTFSGFPVCVPRSPTDPKCPSNNRPAAGTNIIPDATHMAPLRVGDYIDYSGVRKDGETIAYTLVANVDINTSGDQPGFVRVEEAIIGIADTGADVEAARHRFIGLATRSDLLIRVFAIDIDSCTGEETERLVTSVNVIASERNKWEVDVPRNSNIGFYTRNYRIKIGDNEVTTTDGIIAGQYVQPVSEWIFPELVVPGGAPPLNDYTNFGFLVNGFGPINDTIFGQLNPWPGPTAPAQVPATCPDIIEPPPPTGPVTIEASAGPNQAVLGGVSVDLAATQVTNARPSGLTYKWTQINIAPGTAVTLTGATSAKARFPAPVTSSNVTREFEILIRDSVSNVTSTDAVQITSVARGILFDHPVIDSLTWASRMSGSATANAHTELTDPSASMRIVFNSDNVERPMVRASSANGQATYTFSARDIARYTSATVRSYIGNNQVGGPIVSSSNVGAA